MSTVHAAALGFNRTALPVGIEVSGVDLSRPLSAGTFRSIERAFNDNGVLFIRNQTLAPEHLLEFSRRFGTLEKHVRQEYALPGYPEIASQTLAVPGVAMDFHRFLQCDLGHALSRPRCRSARSRDGCIFISLNSLIAKSRCSIAASRSSG